MSSFVLPYAKCHEVYWYKAVCQAGSLSVTPSLVAAVWIAASRLSMTVSKVITYYNSIDESIGYL